MKGRRNKNGGENAISNLHYNKHFMQLASFKGEFVLYFKKM